ncbi:hypothetical protein [Aquicoccus sp. SU-CL01552]|uniref:hypothetical protein n=1 Tax=Aquicoccus sp. SU-CL01552 TaxID=3127656 RepID=UPI00310A50B3
MRQAADLSLPQGGAEFGVLLQCLLLVALIVGALTGVSGLVEFAAVLAVLWVATQWVRLIPMARLFVGLAIASLAAAALLPDALPRLVTAAVQGTGFAALMMVLGLLRQPVKRAAVTRAAAEYLLSISPRWRYGSLLTGTQFMALMFNVGIIPMVGDLTEPEDGRDARHDPARRAMVMAAMRGAALVTIWSPMSLGFAIVTAGVPTVAPLPLIALAFAFTLFLLALSSLLPMLPNEARIPRDASTPAAAGSARALLLVLGASALLLTLTMALHVVMGLGFTLCAVVTIPAFAFIWLACEGAAAAPLAGRLRDALFAMADLRSEAALFLAANVIGAGLSVAIQASPLWPLLAAPGFASLPTLLACLLLIPLAAALYLPNSVMVVLTAQIFGPTLLGQVHPLALGLTLCIGWALAICVNPISAMSLITARLGDVPASRVAHRWNAQFTAVAMACAVVLISAVYAAGG